MTSNLDSPDFTSLATRAMLSLPQSPLVSAASGWNSVDCDVPVWARSLNLLVAVNTNVISLSVTGFTTGFTYLNAVPVYDGGIYYIPLMPVIDAQITVSWYQTPGTLASIYAVASDEPISVSQFNPVSPTHATSERLVYGAPYVCAVNATTSIGVLSDTTTKALRCTVNNANNYDWGRVQGQTTLKMYFDGSVGNMKFPLTPIPVDNVADVQFSVSVHTNAGGPVNLYVVAVNVPDFAGNIPLSNNMAANELAPDPHQSETPNQLPAIYDGTIAASSTVSLVAAISGVQLRVHAIAITQYTAVATAFDIEDTNGNRFYHYHYSAAANSIVVPLFGQLADRSTGLRLHNTTAIISGAVGVTLWYSVL